MRYPHQATLLVALALFHAACEPLEPPAREGPSRARHGIVGGVREAAHPYVVMVGNSRGGFCSGTLISKRTVITAGHCWGRGADAITRVFFETGNPPASSAVGVASAVRHPQYERGASNDLALVNLDADAPVQAVPLLRETMTNTPTFIGPRYSFVGYGDTSGAGRGFGTRRVTVFPIDSVGPKSITHTGNPPAGAVTSIDASEFYYRVPSRNTCSGDSGGPAFVVRAGVERHAGTTSYGDDNCVYDGVQARTDATTLTWIQQTLNTFEAGNPCRADGTCTAGCAMTTPAPLGTLADPDCAEQHVGADGVCVLSASPVDPDCASARFDHCIENGICQPGCISADVDCPPGGKANGQSCAVATDCQSGHCVSGVCCGTACRGACEACSVAAGGTQNGVCSPKAQGAECRPAAGPCDVAETCDGAQASCPADALAAATVECRPAAGACDAAEKCDGAQVSCPADAFAAASVECRPAAGPCDLAEKCDGAQASCPADAFAAALVECRPSAGVCDVAEACDGAQAACPADAFASAATTCRPAAAECDVAETCTGQAAGCPADAVAASCPAPCQGASCVEVPKPPRGCGCASGEAALWPGALAALWAFWPRRRWADRDRPQALAALRF